MRKLALLLCGIWVLLSCFAHGRPSMSDCTRPDTTELRYWGDGDGLDKIYDALVTCENITSLDLDFDWAGCVGPSEPWAFQFKPGDRFPPLQKLSLADYDLQDRWRQNVWYQHKWDLKQKSIHAWHVSSNFVSRLFAGEFDQLWDIEAEISAPKETNLEKWLRAMDFSQVEDLRLVQRDETFYERMGNELPSLKTLQMEWANSGIDVPDERLEFIKSVPSLESLSVSMGAPYYYDNGPKNRTIFPLTTILDTHGQSLRSLALTQLESSEANLRRPMLAVDQIDDIRTYCPQLSHLALDIDRNASYGWPNATLDALTRISSLDFLTLGLELGTDLHSSGKSGPSGWHPDGPYARDEVVREPRMSLDVAKALFQDLRAKKSGNELKRIKFVVGDVEEKPYSGPIYIEMWEDGKAKTFVCEADSGTEHCSLKQPSYRYDYDWFEE